MSLRPWLAEHGCSAATSVLEVNGIVRLEDLLVDDVDAAERLVDDAQTQGVLDAVFFHTLTSGFAAPVRAVGDVVSYAVRPISRRKRRRTDDS